MTNPPGTPHPNRSTKRGQFSERLPRLRLEQRKSPTTSLPRRQPQSRDSVASESLAPQDMNLLFETPVYSRPACLSCIAPSAQKACLNRHQAYSRRACPSRAQAYRRAPTTTRICSSGFHPRLSIAAHCTHGAVHTPRRRSRSRKQRLLPISSCPCQAVGASHEKAAHVTVGNKCPSALSLAWYVAEHDGFVQPC